MKSGIKTFNGQKLTEAREARGLTMTTLAEFVGVTRSAITRYEKGHSAPSAGTLDSFATVLRIPTSFFLHSAEEEERDILFYRSLSSQTKIERLKAERKHQWLKDVTEYVQKSVRLPAPNVPALSNAEAPERMNSKMIQDLARKIRRHWGLGDGPISNVTLLLENNGVIISKLTLDTDKMDGYSGFNKKTGMPYITIARDKESAVRSRLDLAHELGHLVLHRNIPDNLIKNPVHNKVIESQAFEFASNFLMPEETFASEITAISLESLKAMKTRWLVSIAAMLYRINSLGWTTEEEKKRLWISYSRRGWQRNEPLDDEIEEELPRILSKSFNLILEKKATSAGQILSDLRLSAVDVAELAGMDETLLNREQTPSVSLLHSTKGDLKETVEYTVQSSLVQGIN